MTVTTTAWLTMKAMSPRSPVSPPPSFATCMSTTPPSPLPRESPAPTPCRHDTQDPPGAAACNLHGASKHGAQDPTPPPTRRANEVSITDDDDCNDNGSNDDGDDT
ncbi:hypothetical protein EDB84DRAFT_1558725 [Lactarius hengduanensis]|nr:hypothetical protein EDB84DRAFT_1558725 [Lactarius hengduanensis]